VNMSITTTIEAIKAVVSSGSTGIRRVCPPYPGSLNAADLPCCVVVPGEAAWNEHAGKLYRQGRTYSLRYYVKPVGQGKGVTDGAEQCFPLLQQQGYAFVSNPSLDDQVDHIGQQGEFADSGLRGDMEYAGVFYHGFELQISVVEKGS